MEEKICECECGCGEIVTSGKRFKKGHYARVHNNWGHNLRAIANSIKTRRERYIEPWNKGKKGLQVAWNKGLSKEDNHIMAQMAESLSETKKKDEKNKKRMAKISRKYWSKEENRIKQSERIRIATIKKIEDRLENGFQIQPNYNPNAIPIIEEYGKKHGFNFQHAENGGEVNIGGYFPDGLDEKRKTIIEIDEKYHFNKDGNLKKKDIKRQKFLENKGYRVIRIKI